MKHTYVAQSAAMRPSWQVLCLVIFFRVSCWVNAQNSPTAPGYPLSASLTAQLDSLFAEFNAPNTPGCVIGIVRHDSLIVAKGYGLANIEKQQLMSAKTPVYLASVSKQFTAYSIILLAKAGKLNLDDDIRLHLPWFPDLNRKITIRHLLNHTSGIRDHLELATLGGLPTPMGLTQDVAIQYINRSRRLNFEPGQQYLYSNSNYVLLAEIVKQKSGQSFQSFTEATLFKPLHMVNSQFIDSPDELPGNRAISYEKKGNAYFPAFHSVYTLGNGGMFSTLEDLSKWVINFYDPQVGDQQTIRQLAENGHLNRGEKLAYASGITVEDSKGFRKFEHGGALYGYRTMISVFPDLKMGIILLSNNGSVDQALKTSQLADILLKQYQLQGKAINQEKPTITDTMTLDIVRARELCGHYIAEDGLPFTFTMTGQNVYWESSSFGRRRLRQTATMTFEEPSTKVKFVLTALANDTTLQQYYPGNERGMTKFIPNTSFLPREANAYIGRYYSPELASTVEILLQEGQLQIKSTKLGTANLTPLDRKHMLVNQGGNRLYINFFREGENTAGFELTANRSRHLWFDKIK